MRLISFHAKDERFVDLDKAGLITPDVEAGLRPLIPQRLQQARWRGQLSRG